MDKKIILLSWIFPPANHMAGRRAYGFAKYLKLYGWDTYVCTTQISQDQDYIGGIDRDKEEQLDSDSHIIRVPFRTNSTYPAIPKYWRYLKTAIYPTIQPLDYYYNSIRILPSVIKKHGIQVIWATYPPPAPLCIAHQLHKETGIPWIADFRDLWDQTYMYNRYFSSRQRASIIRYLKSCANVVAVTPAICDKLQGLTDAPVSVIYNGYDPEEYTNPSDIKNKENSVFEIVYTGSILRPPMRDPAPVFKAIDLLLETGAIDSNAFRLVFYGANKELLETLLGDSKCREVCLIKESLPHSQIVRVQQHASVLLHLSHPGEKGIMTGKIFEYLAARRPILSVPGDSDCVEKLLASTGAGYCKATVEAIADQILLWYNQKIRRGYVSYTGIETEIKLYSHNGMAMQLANILDQTITG